jgi:hypothetical protein
MTGAEAKQQLIALGEDIAGLDDEDFEIIALDMEAILGEPRQGNGSSESSN